MKDTFFTQIRITEGKRFFLFIFLFIYQLTNAQVDPSAFSVLGTDGICFANASIKVSVPAGNYKPDWVVHIWKGTFTSQLAVPLTGGDIIFNSLTPGTYTVELTNYSSTLPIKTVTLATTYTVMAVNSSFKVPTCKPNSSGYVPNGELTINVPSGGIGPFLYNVTYPTSATNNTPISQTHTSTGASASDRTHTFKNIPGGITPNIVVSDLAGGSAGCPYSTTQNPVLSNNTSADLAYNSRAYNFVKLKKANGICYTALYVNLQNNTTERAAIINQPGNATITIAGVAYNLTRINDNRWTYDPEATGGPVLTNGMPITTKFYWGCSTLQRSTTVTTNNSFLALSQEIRVNTTCGINYTMVVSGDQDTTPDGITDKNIYFLEENWLKFEKQNASGGWDLVPGTDITPNPYDRTITTNPMGVNGATTLSAPSVISKYTFSSPGTYRCTAWDACHTATNTTTFTEFLPMSRVSVSRDNYGVLQGTSGLRVSLGIALSPNLTIKINRADGQTSFPFTATGPLNLAGSYVANFPITRVVPTPNLNNSYLFTDLPLGDYIVELSDGCNNNKTVQVTLNNPAEYSPVFTPILGCTGSNRINYNFGANSNANVLGSPSVRLYRDNGSGGTTGAILQSINASSGTFVNLNAGNYVIVFGNSGPNIQSAAGVVYPQIYTKRVTVDSYGGIKLALSSRICNPSNTNSGIVNVELIDNTILNPTNISLFATSNTTVPIQGPITLGPSETGTIFNNIPIGEYFVRTTNTCTTIDKNISINTGLSSTLPIAKVSRSKICLSDNSTTLSITASNNLYDVVWTDANDSNNTVIGTGTPLLITPTQTKTYRATYSLKSIFNCENSTPLTSDVTVQVTPDPDLTSAVTVSDIDLCLNTSRDFTIGNSQSDFTYELTDSNGLSFASPVTKLSSGGDLIMTIPPTITLTAGNSFKIKVSNGDTGCSGYLTDVVSITSRQNNLNLDVESPSALICPGSTTSITVKATESGVLYKIFKNGVEISNSQGNGLDKVFSIPPTALTLGTNEFLIATSGSGCQNGNLVAKGIVLIDKAPVISAATLSPISLEGCSDLAMPAAYNTIAQLEAKGVTITDETSDASLIVTSTDSAVTNFITDKIITRTYRITDSCNTVSTVNQVITINVKTPSTPTISTASPVSFCQGGSVVLTSSSTSGNQWFRNGLVLNGANASTYTASESANYTVVATNNLGCESPVSTGVDVTANPIPVVTINNGTILAYVNCSVSTIDLTASAGSNYVWYYSDDNLRPFTQIQGDTPTITVSDLGFYKVKVINSSNCEATSQIQIVSAPTISNSQLETCVGNAIKLTADASSFVDPTYQWSKNGILMSGKTTQILDTTEDGIYTVSVTDGRTIGNIGTQTSCGASVKFNPLPIANAGTNFSITCTTNVGGLLIGETEETGFSYTWSSPNGILGLSDAAIANPTANPTETTTYTVIKTNKTTGCWKEDVITVTVDTTLPVANAGTGFTKTCVDNALGKEIGVNTTSGLIYSYSWSPAIGLDDASKPNPVANPSVTTIFTLTVTKKATGCSATNSVTVTVPETPNATALDTKIANNCPVESVDLSTIEPAMVSEIVYEWWTGTSTTRETQITNSTAYSTPGKVYLWSKTTNEGCYNTTPSEVNVIRNACCISNVGELVDTVNLPYLAPADITSLEHTNYASPSFVYYVIVNNLDGKIKQINTSKPEFLQLQSGNYTVHALVFESTIEPTGIDVGNKLSQIQPFCGTSATSAITIHSICNANDSFTETLPNSKEYALLDLTTNQFVQVNTTGTFASIFTGTPYQVVGFNYTGNANGILVGGTLNNVTATDLDITAGSIVTGCVIASAQIEGSVYNDKDRKCIEGDYNQQDLPEVVLYAKLINNNNEVIQVSLPIQSPDYNFSMSLDLLDGTYTVILDDNINTSDTEPTYPTSWTGNSQTFTVVSGQIVNSRSRRGDYIFLPMCMKAIIDKPTLKPTQNLVGNTYNYCQGAPSSIIIVNAIPGAVLNWYYGNIKAKVKFDAPTPDTSIVGTNIWYVTQTINGVESELMEVVIIVHPLPEKPTAIAGKTLLGVGATQAYNVVNADNDLTYKWILPDGFIGNSTTKDIDVQVGTKSGVIEAYAISDMGCVSPAQQLEVRVVVEDDLEVFNSITPNGDGNNESFFIRNIDFYPDNVLSIYNLWGVEVYKANNYGQKEDLFRGFSNGSNTINRDVALPEGTYFYALTYKNTTGLEKNLSGYLYIKH